MQNEVDKILYKMGYFGCDPQKKQEVQDSIAAADGVDKGIPIKELIAPDGMIVALIAQMRD